MARTMDIMRQLNPQLSKKNELPNKQFNNRIASLSNQKNPDSNEQQDERRDAPANQLRPGTPRHDVEQALAQALRQFSSPTLGS